MIHPDRWSASVVRPIAFFDRIVRSTRQLLEIATVDGPFLRACAESQQAMLVDRCSIAVAVKLVEHAAAATVDGLIWVITGSMDDYCKVRSEIEKSRTKRWVYRGHSKFRQHADTWSRGATRIYLSSADELRGAGRYNPRKRRDLTAVFCPLFVIIDSDLGLCSVPLGTTCDPAWAVRDALARLCAQQHMVPLIIFTRREIGSISPSSAQRAFGAAGLLYLRPEPGMRQDDDIQA